MEMGQQRPGSFNFSISTSPRSWWTRLPPLPKGKGSGFLQPHPLDPSWLPNPTSPEKNSRCSDYLGPLQVHPVYQLESQSSDSSDSCKSFPPGEALSLQPWQWPPSAVTRIRTPEPRALQNTRKSRTSIRWAGNVSITKVLKTKYSPLCSPRAPRCPEQVHQASGAQAGRRSTSTRRAPLTAALLWPIHSTDSAVTPGLRKGTLLNKPWWCEGNR